MADLVGQTIGQYQIIERLGRGGMADVYKAFHPGLAVHRALKVIRPEFVTEEGFMERFQREAQAVAGLRHPNLVQIHDFGVQDNLYYMVMEFIEGQDLRSYLAQHSPIRPFDQALPIMQQVAAALTYAHKQGVVHRDIKPGNIMLTKDNQVILTDFGIAKMLASEERMTKTGVGIGTPAYMAPEQARGLPNVGPAADVYSLGIVLYEMLTGHVPFSADTPLAVMLKVVNDPLPPPRDFSPDIPDVLQAVILKATTKNTDHRYPSAEAFVDGFERSLAGHMPPSLNETSWQPAQPSSKAEAAPSPPKKSSKLPWLIAGAALLILCFLATGGAGLVYFFSARPTPSLAAWQFVIDASAGMDETIAGQTKMDIAQEAFVDNLNILPANVEAGLRIFGGGASSENGCLDTELLIEPSTGQRDQLARALNEITPTGEAPLTEAIVRAIGDFDASREVKKTLIIITAGLDTCEADAVAQLETLSRRLGIEFDLQLIGLGVEETANQEELQAIAEATGGDYHNAQSKGDIIRIIEQEVAKLPDAPAPAVAQADASNVTTGQGSLLLEVSDQVSTPEETKSYEFEAEAGQTIYFDYQSADSGIYFILTAPDGRTELFNIYKADSEPTQLDQAGTYTLIADPDREATPAYEFILWNLEPPIVSGDPIDFGQFVSGEITIPGQIVAHEFEAEAGQTIYFDYQSADGNLYFILTAPDGRSELFNLYKADSDPIQLDQAGTYTLTADPDRDATPAYEFILWSLEPPVIDGDSIDFGQFVSGAVTTPGQIVAHEFEAEAGQTIYFDYQSADGNLYFILTALDGRTELFNLYKADSEPIQLDQAGTYTLTADPDRDATPAYEFILWHLEPPIIIGDSIDFGQFVDGKVTTPGQIVTYEFEAEAGQTIFFDYQSADGNLYFILTAPDGRTELFNLYKADSEPIQLDQAGTYTLTADPDRDATPAYEFIMWSLEPPVIAGDSIDFGQFVSGEVTTPGQIVTYEFEAEVGQTIFFDYQSADGGIYFILTAPDGRTELFNLYKADSEPIQLDQTGTYTLTADPDRDATPAYEFVMERQ